MRAASVATAKSLICSNCGGTVALRGAAQATNAVCSSCLTILDATTPSLRILQQYASKLRYEPLIPLGSRGKFDNVNYEAIGFQVRRINVESESFFWSEYLLYNPFQGYLYLSEYQGHWNVIRTLQTLPQPDSSVSGKKVWLGKVPFRHFQNAEAVTVFILGEFPWQIRYDESFVVDDYISPPEVLSSEWSNNERVWSRGIYTPGAEIWKAFGLKGSPPLAKGVYANQPSPYEGRVASAWGTFAILLLVWLAAAIGGYASGRSDKVFESQYSFDSTSTSEPSFVTPYFNLKGRTSSVGIDVDTALENDWLALNVALINDETGTAYNTSKEISYYSGYDSDGRWTEGSRKGSMSIANVPSGRYYMRVEPDMDDDGRMHTADYTIRVKRGERSFFWFIPAFFLLFIPPVFATIRTYSFENTRWAESDYGSPVQISSGGDD